jgi:hypothetical protein
LAGLGSTPLPHIGYKLFAIPSTHL